MAIKIKIGKVVATKGAADKISSNDMQTALARHQVGDWGDLTEEDKQANDEAAKDGERVLSKYTTGGGTNFWIITEYDRTITTILLSEEY